MARHRTADLIRPKDLMPADRRAWEAFAGTRPEWQSPLLRPAFTDAVAKVRDDVWVLVLREGANAIGFLPHHRRSNGFARPVGAPYSDYTALIHAPDADMSIEDAMALGGIHQLAAMGLISETERPDLEAEGAFGIDTSPDAAPTNVNKKLSKNVNRLSRHLEAEHGEIQFVFDDPDPAHFEAMMRIKCAQLRENGLQNVFEAQWVQNLFANLRQGTRDGLKGVLFTLQVAGKPILMQFGPCLGDRMHPWVSAFDPDYRAFSPGQIFLNGCIEPLREAGISYYDLSTGQNHYKYAFCNRDFTVYHGKLYAPNADGKKQQSFDHLKHQALSAMGPKVEALGQRLCRRSDQIAALELTPMGRAKAFSQAVMGFSRRQRASNGASGGGV